LKNTIEIKFMGNFYSRTLDKELRFGDVLQWGVSTPSFYKNKSNLENKDFSIKVCYTSHSVILTPCCTIGKQSKITLAPLVQVRNSFFSNPYFVEDLTRINRILEEPEKSVSPEIWKKMPPKKRDEILEEKKPYAFLNFFIYESNPLFPSYEVNVKDGTKYKTNYYMVDFVDTYKIEYDNPSSPNNFLLKCKCLELSILARTELRDKISYYYGRSPKEDLVYWDYCA